MNLFHTHLKDISSGPLIHVAVRLCAICLVFIAAITIQSCTDDKLVDDPTIHYADEDIVSIDFPGYIGINITSTAALGTRADGFEDGEEDEYALAEGSSNHFVLIYKSEDNGGSSTDKPLLVMALNLENPINEATPSVTVSVNSAVTSKEMSVIYDKFTDYGSDQARVKEDFLNNILAGNEAYVLLNFDCGIVDMANTKADIRTNNSNAANLARITKSQLLSLPVKDYKIKGTDDKDYFTMANAVYLKDNKYFADHTIDIGSDGSKVKERKDAAIADPVISAYVERLAVKYTIKIVEPSHITTSGNGNGTSGNEEDPQTHEGTSAVTGENPYFTFSNILKYNNRPGERGYTIDSNGGYKIPSIDGSATVTVIGYGVSNLEKSSYLLKKIEEEGNYFTDWNDAGHQRSNWSVDKNYAISKAGYGYANAAGYPHQFRAALDTDTITSLFANDGNGYTYKGPNNYYEDVTNRVNGVNRTTRYYNQLGTINIDNLNSDCVLQYKSYDELLNLGRGFTNNASIWDGVSFYTLENTYMDPGMTGGSWAWQWNRAPYSTSTVLILLCQISIDDFVGDEGDNTVYKGQNNIFYSQLYGEDKGLINSKLNILNDVMLNGGNAGLQILDGKWDGHQRGTQETLLDKVAWNENSRLWIGIDPEESTIASDSGERSYREMTAEDFCLIPAELSGGDGQRLIAPQEKYMGKRFHYYLTPYTSADEIKNADPNNNLTVEINFNHLVGLIHKIIGPIDVYRNGYMYYAVPISNNESSFDLNSWKTLGATGVVRNNWYQVTISDISNVGTPVDDIYQPIVPVMDIRRSYVNMGVKVMNWHTITQGNIPM